VVVGCLVHLRVTHVASKLYVEHLLSFRVSQRLRPLANTYLFCPHVFAASCAQSFTPFTRGELYADSVGLVEEKAAESCKRPFLRVAMCGDEGCKGFKVANLLSQGGLAVLFWQDPLHRLANYSHLSEKVLPPLRPSLTPLFAASRGPWHSNKFGQQLRLAGLCCEECVMARCGLSGRFEGGSVLVAWCCRRCGLSKQRRVLTPNLRLGSKQIIMCCDSHVAV
jgi:hypothetical protein